MRVVLIPQGTHGDVRPLVALGQAFRSAGHDVVLGAPPNCRAWIEGLKFSFRPFGIDMETPTDDAERSMGNPIRSVIIGMRLIGRLVSSQFASLPDLAADADLIIGSGLEFAGRTVAEHLSIPYRFVCHVPTALRSKYHPPLAIPYRRFPPWVNRMFWWSNALGLRWTFGRNIQANRRCLGLLPVPDLQAFLSDGVLLAADEALAPLPPDCHVDFRTSYFALEDEQPLPADLERFLDEGPAPIYVGFGSMIERKPSKTLDMLIELSQDFRVIVRNERVRRLCSTTPINVHFVESVPHHVLFRRVAAVVHHGGAGTTHTAARAGVPQIIVPHMIDQYYWAHRVQELGIGPAPLRLATLSASTLRAAIRQITPGSPIQRATVELRDKLMQAATSSLNDTVGYCEKVHARSCEPMSARNVPLRSCGGH